MRSSNPSPARLLSRLVRAQRQQEKRAHQVDKARARLARHAEGLATCEARVAHVEGLLASARATGGGARLRDALLIFNPKAGREGDDNALRLAQIVTALREHGIRATIQLKTSGKATRQAVRKVVDSGGGLVVVAAGDGTIGDVAAELVGAKTVMGIIPVGTMNNLARSLGVPLGIENAPIMANKLLCAPDAKMDDGLLDVSVYDGMGKAALTEHFLAVAAGGTNAVPTWRARKIRISASDALPANADMNVTPLRRSVDIEVIAHAVAVIVGNGIGLSTPMLTAPSAPAFAPDPPLVTRATVAADQATPDNGV